LGLSFRIGFYAYILKWFERSDSVTPVASTDLKRIGQNIKHMNIVEHAQGYIFRERGWCFLESDITSAFKYLKMALDKFSMALENNPDVVLLHNCTEVMILLWRIKKRLTVPLDSTWVKQTEEYLKRAIKINPSNSKTLYLYAQFFRYCTKEMEQAEDFYLRALDINPNYIECLRKYGGFLEQNKEVAYAAKFYDRARKLPQT